MPESALTSGCIDFVLSPEDIARKIIDVATAAAVSDRGLVIPDRTQTTA